MPSARIAMNYLKAYCKLVRKEEAKGLTKKEAKKQGIYVEGHHVFPKCIYGKSSQGNTRIVYVSARVHYILHALLEKAFIKRYGFRHWKTKSMTFAHIKMKGYVYNKRYTNNLLYEGVRKRFSEIAKNKKMSKEAREKLSKSRIGRFGGRNHYLVHPLKIYFENGTTLTYEDGIHNFCREYGYGKDYVGSLVNGKRKKKYKDIIKVEKLEKPKIAKQKTYKKIFAGRYHKSSIPVRIYFADGRILDCPDGCEYFCKVNPKYTARVLSAMRRGERTMHKDIVKVEDLNKEKGKPIVKKYHNKNYVPIKIYFSDGRTIIEEKGATEFCIKNPEYMQAKISAVSLGKRKTHRDIIKVERLVEW